MTGARPMKFGGTRVPRCSGKPAHASLFPALLVPLFQLLLAAGWITPQNAPAAHAPDPPLKISVYATAGAVNRYLVSPEGRAEAAGTMARLRATKIWIEGRRGDQYVTPELLRAVRDDFRSRGLEVSGAIATVRGSTFGVPATHGLQLLNFQAGKTQRDIARFFAENAAIFEEIIIDDFFATRDASPESEQARGTQSWSEYRRNLLVSLMDSVIMKPARAANPSVRIIVKYPRWIDHFHELGYDPPRMSAIADRTWVGTETRNPHTESSGYVQPIEGYLNYRWLASIATGKTGGAWFDYIDCTAQNFVDQAYQSVLAGAPELTLHSLSALMRGHPGNALLISALPELFDLAAKVRGLPARGVAYYQPAGSDGEENYYLMEYLGMIGLPMVPRAAYPEDFSVAVLGAHAAADPRLLDRAKRHLGAGATVVLTPALIRRLGAAGAELAGVRISGQAQPAVAGEARIGREPVSLDKPLELDGGLEPASATILISALLSGRRVPLLTSRKGGRGRALVWNVRTFGKRDAGALAPSGELGLPEIPQRLADALREQLLSPLKLKLSAPARVGFYLLGDERVFYNFRDEPVEVRIDANDLQLDPNRLLWFGQTSGRVPRNSNEP